MQGGKGAGHGRLCHVTTLFPLPPYSHDRHRVLDDFRKPVRRLEACHHSRFELQRLGQFVVEHWLAGDPPRREGQSNEAPADAAVVVLLMASQ
jgi:hypothetical protein